MATRFPLDERTTLALHEGEGIGHCTGDVIWEASYVTARFVADADLLPRALLVGDGEGEDAENAAGGADEERPPRVLDLSAGAGLVGITCACLGASVVMSDVGDVGRRLLQMNIDANAERIARGGGRCAAYSYCWGDEALGADHEQGASAEGATRAAAGHGFVQHAPFPLVLCVDCVFIALRDSIQTALLQSLVFLCGGGVGAREPDDTADGSTSGITKGSGVAQATSAAGPAGVGAAAQASSCTAAPQLVLCWKSRLPHAEEAFLRRLARFFVLEEQSRDVVARCSADLDPQRAAAGAAEAAGGDGDSDSDSDFEGGGFESLFHNEEEETVRLMLGRLREEHRVTEASKQSQ